MTGAKPVLWPGGGDYSTMRKQRGFAMPKEELQPTEGAPTGEGAPAPNADPARVSKAKRTARCDRDFDVPYRGTTTPFTKGQRVDDADLLDYLDSVSAPITYVED